MLTVVSPFDHLGGSARLSAALKLGSTPLPNQYKPRHISPSKSLVSLTESAAEVMIGRIQFGAVPGGSAQVMVPECWGPVASAGRLPNEPLMPTAGVVGFALPQAASAVTPASASAVNAAPERRTLRITPHPLRRSRP